VNIVLGYLSDNDHITPALPMMIDARPWDRNHLSVNGSRMTQLNVARSRSPWFSSSSPSSSSSSSSSGTTPFILVRVSTYLSFPGYLVMSCRLVVVCTCILRKYFHEKYCACDYIYEYKNIIIYNYAYVRYISLYLHIHIYS